MPTGVLRYCAQPGCSTLVSKGRCAQHAVPAWRGLTPPPVRIRGRKLQRLRQQLFDKQPLCVQCVAEGRTRKATIRDHIVPLAEGGADNETNEQALCQECSDRKTEQEKKRGITRHHG